MKIIKLNSKNIDQVINDTISTFKSNGLVIFPSDTVYGVLCDAGSESAVKKLIAFKNRPAGKPISVFCDFNLLESLVKIDKEQSVTLKQILPGPFTIILQSRHKVNKLLESETGTLGIRIPLNKNIEMLIKQFQKPVTATSANLAGRSPHYSIESLLNELSEKQKEMIDLFVDAGNLPRNKPSTVVDLTKPDIEILRQGDGDFLNTSDNFFSNSSEETKSIAKRIFNKHYKKDSKPLVFIIEGEMGVGKTIFVKGIGEELGITNIISPTFVIYYEYGNFYHFDLYQIEEKEEFKHLGIEKLLVPGNILCFEWGEKAGEIIKMLKENGRIVYVKMKYITEHKREIILKNI
jgi:L-threonylcarbamoyladenylate synthase